jgi:hypothetical protein
MGEPEADEALWRQKPRIVALLDGRAENTGINDAVDLPQRHTGDGGRLVRGHQGWFRSHLKNPSRSLERYSVLTRCSPVPRFEVVPGLSPSAGKDNCAFGRRGSAASPSAGFPLLQLLLFAEGFVVRHDEIDMADAERGRKIVNAHDCRIAQAAFDIADILPREAGHFGETLLRESFLPAQSRKIPTHQLAHVHGRKLQQYIL